MNIDSVVPSKFMNTTCEQEKVDAVQMQQQQVDELLSEAMKQPGVMEAMEAFDQAEKANNAAAAYSSYIEWFRVPAAHNACSASCELA